MPFFSLEPNRRKERRVRRSEDDELTGGRGGGGNRVYRPLTGNQERRTAESRELTFSGGCGGGGGRDSGGRGGAAPASSIPDGRGRGAKIRQVELRRQKGGKRFGQFASRVRVCAATPLRYPRNCTVVLFSHDGGRNRRSVPVTLARA